MARFVYLFITVGVLLTCLPAGASGQSSNSTTSASDFRGRLLTAEADNIDRALRLPATVDFYETTFDDVLAYVAQEHEIAILLHESARDFGLDESSLTTIRLGQMPLISVLENILEPYDCTVTLHQDVLKIVARDVATAMPEKRIYNLDGLVARLESTGASDLVQLITETVDPDSWEINGGTARLAEIEGKLVVTQTLTNHLTIERLLTALDREMAR